MRRILLSCILLLVSEVNLMAQTPRTGFFKISGPEKWWVIGHPFKARRAWSATERTLHLTDSLKQAGVLGKDLNGGRLDAFKHAFWMTELSSRIGEKAALSLGEAHERGNYKAFLRRKSEDGAVPDKASTDMDLFNNEVGVSIFREHPIVSESERMQLVIDQIIQGKMKVLKKDKGRFLNCDGDPIDLNSFKGEWENDKCLVFSDQL